jgi:FAD/FMN-containing dehydrogenase
VSTVPKHVTLFKMFSLYSLVTLAIVFPTLSLSASNTTDEACNAIAAADIKTETFVLDPDFITAADHYWSAANADNTPACVVSPTSAEEVSTIVKVLLNYTDVAFAVKGGGHNPNVGFSSVNEGVLITMSDMASTNYSDDAQTAYIGPGARWDEVMNALESKQVGIVGGRLGQP